MNIILNVVTTSADGNHRYCCTNDRDGKIVYSKSNEGAVRKTISHLKKIVNAKKLNLLDTDINDDNGTKLTYQVI